MRTPFLTNKQTRANMLGVTVTDATELTRLQTAVIPELNFVLSMVTGSEGFYVGDGLTPLSGLTKYSGGGGGDVTGDFADLTGDPLSNTALADVLNAKLTAAQGAAVPNAAAAPTMEEFNTLLASLRTAGIIAT